MNRETHPSSMQFGPYIVDKPLSLVGRGDIFIAQHESTGQKVVLRTMALPLKDTDRALAQCNEVLADMVRLDVPHVLKILDYGNDNTTLYLITPVMPGGSLQTRMTKRLELSSEPQLPAPGEVLQLVHDLAEALDTLHLEGITHGQVGPGSIVLDENGEAYLTEVGITRLAKFLFKLDTSNSLDVSRYSAPELWEGERPEPATDQYALACLAYELLTGQPPFDNTSIARLMQAHSDDVAPPPHYIRPELPGDLSMVFWQALAKPVDRRFPTVMAFHDSLEVALGDNLGEPTEFFTFPLDG